MEAGLIVSKESVMSQESVSPDSSRILVPIHRDSAAVPSIPRVGTCGTSGTRGETEFDPPDKGGSEGPPCLSPLRRGVGKTRFLFAIC
jgi:hypothetical protein